jgi:acetylornithine deacetylase/succinyl-diaminopimelate desuccinylase-like protein
LLGVLAARGVPAAASGGDQAADALAYEVFKQLIGIDTTDSIGNVTTAAEAMARRFRDAGFAPADVVVLGPANERKKNLVVRLHGTGAHKPVLLIGHLDVVEARREDWHSDPFELSERDGYFYGRGTLDMKGPDAMAVAALIRLKQERWRPSRDVILALTADEETGCCNGVDWLLRNHRELVDADFVLNQDDYSVLTEQGAPLLFRLFATEKTYADFDLTVTDAGGHSSEPGPDNAIYRLARGLTRLAAYEFPFELNEVTRGYFERMASIDTGERSADMRAILHQPPDAAAIARLSRDAFDHAAMHTTCVATRLEGGHANNALPSRARAIVNCRILPGHAPEDVRQTLIGVLADPAIAVRYVGADSRLLEHAPLTRGTAPPTLRPEVVAPLEQLVGETWPHLKVVPSMAVGASDSTYTNAAGLPTYVFSGLAVERGANPEHAADERLAVASFYTANRFWYRYLKALTAQ